MLAVGCNACGAVQSTHCQGLKLRRRPAYATSVDGVELPLARTGNPCGAGGAD